MPKENIKDIKDCSLLELKAMVYDEAMILEQTQRNIEVLKERIRQLEAEPND